MKPLHWAVLGGVALAVIWLFDRWMRLKTVEYEQRAHKHGGHGKQPNQRQAAPRPAAPQAKQHRVSQE